jgi:hypothetical protein
LSSLSWLDHSDGDRRKMLDVIDLFQQKGTVDELGLGGIRDTIADVLTPGTSTIQSRARYFFFIPWIYQSLEGGRLGPDKVAAAARRLEIALAAELAKAEDKDGTIGIEAGEALKRLPSSVYWAGLRRLGFRAFPGPIDRYHKTFGNLRGNLKGHEADDPDTSISFLNWNSAIPPAPKGFPIGATHKLTEREASFFCEQISHHAADSLLHFMVDRRDIGQGTKAPWEHPLIGEMPESLREWLFHARCYAELIFGATLLYNLMLAEKAEREHEAERYLRELDEWVERVAALKPELPRWSRDEFWYRIRRINPRTSVPAEVFSNRWIDLVLSSKHTRSLIRSTQARQLIDHREYQLKGPRARLRSPAHLEMWGGDSGAIKFNYRWGITRTTASDIVAALES